MYGWDRISRVRQSAWHNDHDERQHLDDKPAEGEVGLKPRSRSRRRTQSRLRLNIGKERKNL
jgi:hypothetical protein